jgi:hypothetical protein
MLAFIRNVIINFFVGILRRVAQLFMLLLADVETVE